MCTAVRSGFSTLAGNVHAPIRDRVVEFAGRDGIHEFSYGYGFPFADVPFNSPTVNCWAATAELAESTAREFAEWVWENRAQFVCHPISAAQAVALALDELGKQGRSDGEASSAPMSIDEVNARLDRPDEETARSYGFLPDDDAPGPVVIAEKSDNTGGGAPGDATHVLHELIRNGVQRAAVVNIIDPDTVAQAIAAGVGQVIDVSLGGKRSHLGGKPVDGEAYVKTISDGRYTIRSAMGH